METREGHSTWQKHRAETLEYMDSGIRPPGFPLISFDTLSRLPCLRSSSIIIMMIIMIIKMIIII